MIVSQLSVLGFLTFDCICHESNACTIQEAGISSYLLSLYIGVVQVFSFWNLALVLSFLPVDTLALNQWPAWPMASKTDCVSVSSYAYLVYLFDDLVESLDFLLSLDLHSPIPQGLKAEFNFSDFLSLCLGATHSHSPHPIPEDKNEHTSSLPEPGLIH